MIPYDQAVRWVRDAAVLQPAETVTVAASAGRVLADAVRSGQCLPPFDNSAMDGFALRLAGDAADQGAEFDIRGWQAAGDDGAVADAGAWEIMTGARLPEGLDSVVPIEDVEVLQTADGRPTRIRLRAVVTPGQFVRRRGQDVATGEQILAGGTLLDTNAVTLLHAIGIGTVSVRARPRVAIIATGKELVSDATQALQSGQIRDSNRPYLVARLAAAGAEVVADVVVGDEVERFNSALDEALAAGAQIVLSTGAVSAGRYDFIPDALRARGARIVFHKVAIRPGKPLLFAVLADGTAYFGLPGNPASTAVGQRFFVEPMLRRMLGLADEQGVQMALATDTATPPGLRFHTRAVIRADASGRLTARPLAGQESFRLQATVQATGWAVLDGAGEQAAAGSAVQVFSWGHADALRFAAHAPAPQEIT